MAKNQFAEPHFHDEAAARVWFEAARWPNGPICPKCGSAKHYATKKLGRYRCAAPTCRKDFTVMTGTVHGTQPREAYSVGPPRSIRRLKRGVFRCVVDLQAAINRFVLETNNDPKPLTWTADPDKIIAAVRRGHQVLDSIH
jgi:hypothetical protein